MSCSTAAWIRSAAMGKDLQAKMTEMLGKDEVSPEDMMALQFEVGQYKAMLESLSVRHEEHDGYDEEPCPAYRLSLSPVRNHVPGPHPGCFAWLHPAHGASDGMRRTRRRGCPLLPFLRLAGGARAARIFLRLEKRHAVRYPDQPFA